MNMEASLKATRLRFPWAKPIAVIALAGATLGQANATDAAGEYFGYFRAGVGSNSAGGSQACFGLEGVSKYRLGNECDFYGEFGYRKELVKASNGASFVGTVMANAWSPTSDIGSSSLALNQMFVEVKNLDFLRSGSVWMGKRLYNQMEVHTLAFKYVQMDGIGAGIDGISMGPGKFSYALFRNDIDQSKSATRHNFIYQDLPVNVEGTLKFDATVITPDSSVPGSHGGWSLSIAHKQAKILGGNNTIALQHGVGPGMLISGTGDIARGADYTRTRVVDQLIWQITPNLTGSANFVVQRDKSAAGTQTWVSVGARPVYSLTENLKLQLDVGHDRISPAGNGATQKLTKITFAPTISAGRGFWSRPELRVFVTYAKWNDAAQRAATSGSALSRTGVFGGRVHGISYGVQVETWF